MRQLTIRINRFEIYNINNIYEKVSKIVSTSQCQVIQNRKFNFSAVTSKHYKMHDIFTKPS